MKCSTIQRENVNRGYSATIIATNVQNGVPFPPAWTQARRYRLHSSVASLTTVCCTPDQTALRRCCSWSLKSFKNHSKWSLSTLLLQILSRIC